MEKALDMVNSSMTGRKKCRWETWHNGKFANNYFNSFDEAIRWFDGFMAFNGFSGKRQDYRVY